MNKKVFIALAMSASIYNAYAQNINVYTPGENEGIAYFLPKTSVEVNIIATKIKYTPGDFCQYANRYLRINNVTSEPSTYWQIKDISVSYFGIPDSTKAYIIKLDDKNMMSNLEITDNGIIKAINTKSQEIKKTEFTLEKSKPEENPKKYMTEEILSAGSTAKMAELTAKEIYNIRESKNMILRGQAETMPKDGTSLKLIIDNLDKQEKALISLFTGSLEKEDKLFTAKITPTEDVTNSVLFRFSQKLGIIDSDNLAGEPIYLNIKRTSPAIIVSQDEKDDKKKKKLKGAIYNIPGKGSIKMTFNGKVLFNDDAVSFAQFGNTEVLVDGLFSKKVNTRVIFNTATGGIQKIDKD